MTTLVYSVYMYPVMLTMQSMKLRMVGPIAFLDGLHSALGPRFVSHSGISSQADSSTLGLVQISLQYARTLGYNMKHPKVCDIVLNS